MASLDDVLNVKSTPLTLADLQKKFSDAVANKQMTKAKALDGQIKRMIAKTTTQEETIKERRRLLALRDDALNLMRNNPKYRRFEKVKSLLQTEKNDERIQKLRKEAARLEKDFKDAQAYQIIKNIEYALSALPKLKITKKIAKESNIKEANQSTNLLQALISTISTTPEKKNLVVLPTSKASLIRNPLTGRLVKNNNISRRRINANIAKKNSSSISYNQEVDESALLTSKFQSIDFKVKRSDVGFFIGIVNFTDINNRQELFEVLKQLQTRISSKNVFVLSYYSLLWVEDGKGIYRTFNPDNLVFGYEFFEQALEEMESGGGDQYGSDPINMNTARLVNNMVKIYVQQIDRPEGVSDKLIFPVVDVNSLKGYKKNNCLKNCIKYLGLNIPTEKQENLDVFIKYVRDEGIELNIYSNIISKLNISNIKKRTPELKQIIAGSKIRKLALYRIIDGDFEIQKRLDRGRIDGNGLIFCPNSNHIDIIKKFELEELYCNTTGTIYKLNKFGFAYELYKGDTINTERKIVQHEPIINTLYYVFFDYETVIDYHKSNCLNPYSVSYFYISHTELFNISGAGSERAFNINEETTKKIFEDKSRCVNITGFDCNKKFIDFLKEFQRDKKVVLVSYNGANFDNFILYDGIKKSYKDDDDNLVISNVLFNGNQILNFKINNTHSLYDLNRFIAGSLAENCKSFGVPEKYFKISGYNHDEIQNFYDTLSKEEFISKLKGNNKLEDYNNNDVYSLAIIFSKWFKSLYELKEDFTFSGDLYDFTDKITIGSLGYTSFNKNLKKIGTKLPQLDISKYQLIQKYKVAGRVDLFGKPNNKVLERVFSIDRCSQYPYLMAVAPVYYPCGDIKQQKSYIHPDENIGWFMCNIDQRPLINKNLPPIYPKKVFNSAGDSIENNFDNYEPLENYFINNYEIEHLKKYGAIVEIIEHEENFIFTDKIKGCKLFRFILNWMKLKNNQDDYKKSKSVLYNCAMRETYKLLMNCISGKVIEGLHVEKTTVINDKEKFKKLTEKYNINVINEIGEEIYLSYKVEEDEIIKQQKPIYLGCLIYTYSRGCMYDDIISKIGRVNCLYMDTDSVQMTEESFKTWQKTAEKEIVPHWPEVEEIDGRYKTHKKYEEGTKVFGSFENELEDNNINYYLQKKFHGHFMINNKEIEYIKVRFKGVQRNSLFLNGTENIIIVKDDKYIKNKTDEEINKFSLINKNLEIGADYSKADRKGELKNQLGFFEELHTNKIAAVLCRGLKRVVKNSNRGVELGEIERFNTNNNTVQATFTIKNIVIN